MADVSTAATSAAAAVTTPQTTSVDPKLEAAKGAQGITGASGEPGAEMTKEQAREEIRKHKLKVDGQEIEVDEEELKRGYSHQRAANKILQEGKAAKKQAETFVQMMKDKTKLFEAIKKLGHDPRKLSEEFLASQLEEELMDPREKDLRDTKNKLKQYEELERMQKEAEIKRRDEELKAKYAKDYSAQFVDALKASNLPPTKEMVAEMAKYISRAAKLDFEMTALEAAKLVREDLETAHRNLYGNADADVLVKLLGDQGLQKIRAFDTSRLKDPNAQLKTPQDQGETQPRTRPHSKPMTPKEWREFNRK